jgi:hypothetical protein
MAKPTYKSNIQTIAKKIKETNQPPGQEKDARRHQIREDSSMQSDYFIYSLFLFSQQQRKSPSK